MTELLDLCDVSIIHRFRSPTWSEALKNHLAGMVWSGGADSTSGKRVFDTIVGLGDGEALLFCPGAYLDVPVSLTTGSKAEEKESANLVNPIRSPRNNEAGPDKSSTNSA